MLIEQLFQPYAVSSLQTPNRFVMAPMTRRASPDGVPTVADGDYYEQRAAGGTGLLITEGTYVDRLDAGSSPDVPRMAHGTSAEGWRSVVDRVHAHGSRIIPQLWHTGVARGTAPEWNPQVPSLSPSGIDLSGERAGTPMSPSDLEEVIEAFADAAALAREIGFDGVEIHGAHGYLLDQFIWDTTNQRTDRYGGASQRQRVAYPCEVVRAVRSVVGNDFPISFRFSQWKIGNYGASIAQTPRELEQFLKPLVDAGVDVFHCSSRRHWQAGFPGHGELSLSGWTRKITGRPVITVGSVGVDTEFHSDGTVLQIPVDQRLELLAEQFERGEFDLVAIGRAVLADPAWVNKVRHGQLNDVIPYKR